MPILCAFSLIRFGTSMQIVLSTVLLIVCFDEARALCCARLHSTINFINIIIILCRRSTCVHTLFHLIFPFPSPFCLLRTLFVTFFASRFMHFAFCTFTSSSFTYIFIHSTSLLLEICV